MKNDQYFPMEVQFLNNENVMLMMFKLDAATAVGVYTILLQHLRKMDDYKASCNPISLDAIAYMYRIDRVILESVIRDYGLFEIDEEHQIFRSYYLDRVMQPLEERRCVKVENGKKGGRLKKKTVASETPMDKGEKPNQNQESKVKESKEEKSKEGEKAVAEAEEAEDFVVAPSSAAADDNDVWDEEEQQRGCKLAYRSG